MADGGEGVTLRAGRVQQQQTQLALNYHQRDDNSTTGSILNQSNQNDGLEESGPSVNMSDDSSLMEESLPSIDQHHHHNQHLTLDRFHSLRIYMTTIKSLPYNLRIHG